MFTLNKIFDCPAQVPYNRSKSGFLEKRLLAAKTPCVSSSRAFADLPAKLTTTRGGSSPKLHRGQSSTRAIPPFGQTKLKSELLVVFSIDYSFDEMEFKSKARRANE